MLREYRDNRGLSFANMQSLAPAVMATSPSIEVSDKYSFVPTIEIIENLSKQNWFPVSVKQSVKTQFEDTGKHMVRFQHPDISPIGIGKMGEDKVELVLINSHNGRSSLNLFFGIFRFVCLNGAVIGRELERFQSIHVGLGIDEVNKITFIMADQAKMIAGTIETFQNRILSFAEQRIFAQEALKMRYPVPVDRPIKPETLLKARRLECKGNDLWNVYNNVQENLLKGGLSDRSNPFTTKKMSPVKQISEDVRINTELWELAKLAV